MPRFINRLPYILTYLVAFVLGLKQLREPDVWWQLLSGRWMLEHNAITHKDVFSFTMAGQPWVNVKWLYEILIAALEKAMGPEVVILLQAGINVLIVYLLFQIINRLAAHFKLNIPPLVSTIPILLFLAIVEYRMAGRPEMISHLMCTLYLFILCRNPEMDIKKVWVLIPLQCIWANMHEGYPVGMVMIGAMSIGSLFTYLIKKDKHHQQVFIRSIVLLLAAAVIILLNPNTIQLWKQPFEIYRQVWANKYTTELYSISHPEYWTLQAKMHVTLLSLILLLWVYRFSVAVRNKDTHALIHPFVITYLLLILLLGYLSLTANRNIPFSQIVLLPSIPYFLVWLGNKFKTQDYQFFKALLKHQLTISSIIAFLCYVSIVNNSYYKFTNSANRYGVHTSTLHNPMGVVDFIKQHNIQGPVFSDYFVSSYLLWSLYPDFKSYIDLRDLDVFPTEFFDEYFSMYNQPDKFDSLNKKYNFNYIVFSNSQLPALQQRLYYGTEYNLIYVDPVSSLYLKNGTKNEAINRDPRIKLFHWPQAYEDPAWAGMITGILNPMYSYEEEDEKNMPVYGARFYNQVQGYPTAIKLLLPALNEFQDDANAYNTIGKSYLGFANMVNRPEEVKRKLDSAEVFLLRAVEIDPKIATAYVSLADIAMMKNDFVSAKKHYQKSITLDDSKPAVFFHSGVCSYYLLQSTGDAEHRKDIIDNMQHCLQYDKDNRRAYLYLAYAYNADGDTEAAKKPLAKVIALNNPLFPQEEKMLAELRKSLKM